MLGAVTGGIQVSRELCKSLTDLASSLAHAPEAVDSVRREVHAIELSLNAFRLHLKKRGAASRRASSHLALEDMKLVLQGCVTTLDRLRTLLSPVVASSMRDVEMAGGGGGGRVLGIGGGVGGSGGGGGGGGTGNAAGQGVVGFGFGSGTASLSIRGRIQWAWCEKRAEAYIAHLHRVQVSIASFVTILNE